MEKGKRDVGGYTTEKSAIVDKSIKVNKKRGFPKIGTQNTKSPAPFELDFLRFASYFRTFSKGT